MNTNNNNNKINNTYIHKKRVHTPVSEESDMFAFGLPRKKFISEESFANDMAAMSLYPTVFENQQAQQQNKNIVRIDDINEFLLSEGEETESTNYMETNEASVINHDINGLPLELKPGEKKPRIPDFVIDSSSSLDPRDRIALENMIKSKPNNVHIEVLNMPNIHYTPTSMDID